ncbi:MAG: signal peptidase II [Planctomycetaceae bacterium]
MNMEKPRRNTLLFLILVLAATFFDIYSKNVVFKDLGFYSGPETVIAGSHEIFTPPMGVQGQSMLMLDNWVVFQFYTNFNFGALWGMGQGFSLIFGLFGMIAIIGILTWAFYFDGIRSKWLTVSLGLILAGTLGNLWDRFGLHGYEDPMGNTIYAVRDFLFFRFGGRDGYQWPIFNFADTFLVVGAVMMFLHSLFVTVPEKQPEDEPVSPASNSNPAAN